MRYPEVTPYLPATGQVAPEATMTVHLVLYSSGPESSAKTISVHQTKLGAYKALRAFILHRWHEFRDSEIWWRHHDPERGYRSKFGAHEWWGLGQMELQP